MKKLFMVLMLTFLSACCIPYPAAATPVDVSATAAKSTVSIEMGHMDMWVKLGTGVAVKKIGLGEVILTASHVAMAEPDFQHRACAVVEPESCVMLDRFVFNSGGGVVNDWAAYFVDELPAGVVPASRSRKLSTGQSVATLGFPDGGLWASYGNASTYYSEGHWGLDMFARPGNSGGGVWDDNGRLVGLVIALRIQDNMGVQEMETHQSLMVPISAIQLFSGAL